MKKGFFIVLISIGLATMVTGQHDPLGLGIVVGEPTGISLKYWTGGTTAVDGAVAWSFNHGGSFYVHADFLQHHFEIIDISEGEMPLYYGIGGKMVLADEPLLGVHIPLGISYIFEQAPLDVFLEIRPGINLIPATEFDMGGGIGIRYYFSQ